MRWRRCWRWTGCICVWCGHGVLWQQCIVVGRGKLWSESIREPLQLEIVGRSVRKSSVDAIRDCRKPFRCFCLYLYVSTMLIVVSEIPRSPMDWLANQETWSSPLASPFWSHNRFTPHWTSRRRRRRVPSHKNIHRHGLQAIKALLIHCKSHLVLQFRQWSVIFKRI